MKPLINWEELRKLGMPADPPPESNSKENMWDNSANMYNQMAAMEREYTRRYLDLLPITKEDSVLDVGCGPGRVAVLTAQRAKRVTAIDSAEKMLAHCKNNAKLAGVENLDARFLDWNQAVLGENLEQHDIAIASRSVGLSDLRKLSSFAKKFAVIMAWANGPSIPELLDRLFAGTSDKPPFRMVHDRRLSYNVMYNIVYDMGYEPNIRIVPDGFQRLFASKQEAYEELSHLKEMDEDKMPIFEKNVDQFLTETKDGYWFEMKTRSFVMWWDTQMETL